MKHLLITLPLAFLVLTSCSSVAIDFDKKYGYRKLVKENTQSEKKYSGFVNLYQVSVTYMNEKVLSLKNQKLATLQQWPSHKVEEASQNLELSLAKSTKFMVLLYTPVVKNNDLTKGDDSIWRTYLEVNGQRFPGTISKTKYTMSQVATLFPNVNIFMKPYEVSFDIADREALSSGAVKFVLTSNLGTSEFEFKNK